jgi:hypothetical protein
MSAFADGFIQAAGGTAFSAGIQTTPQRWSGTQQSGVILREAPRRSFLSRRTVAPTEESLSATVRPVERWFFARAVVQHSRAPPAAGE